MFAQQPKDFTEIKRFFPDLSYPYCLDYDVEKFENNILAEKIYPYDDILALDRNNVRKYFLHDSEKVYVVEEHFQDTVFPRFFAIGKLKINEKFTGFLMERQHEAGGYYYSVKFLCVLDNQGKLMSKIIVASAESIFVEMDNSSGPDAEIVIRAAIEKGCVEKDGQVFVSHNPEFTEYFRVNDKGELILKEN